MKTTQKKFSLPCRAWIVRVMPETGYCDSLSVQVCTAVKQTGDLVECEVRVGSAVETRIVTAADLASSQARALAKITLALHALDSRPLPSPVAGMTESGACKLQASAA